MSSRAARRAGRTAATMPATAASPRITTSGIDRCGEHAEALLGLQRPHQAPAEERAQAEPADRAEDGDDAPTPSAPSSAAAPATGRPPAAGRAPACARGSTATACCRCPSGRSARRCRAGRRSRPASGRPLRPSRPTYSSRVCGSGAWNAFRHGRHRRLAVGLGRRRRRGRRTPAGPSPGRRGAPSRRRSSARSPSTSRRSKTAPTARSVVVAVDERHRHDVAEGEAVLVGVVAR